MRIFCVLFIAFFQLGVSQQPFHFPDKFSKTAIAGLKNNDSLLFYQCHVDEAKTEIKTTSGEIIKGESKKITITEKYIIYLKDGIYSAKYFTSTLTSLPNRKFSYLKVKEKDYWNFKLEKSSAINEHDVLTFAAIELTAHDTNEFDFVIDKYNTNALIIRNKKTMRHLVVEGNHTLRTNLEMLR